MRLIVLLALSGAIAVAGCKETRQANPVQISQPGDAALECQAIAGLQHENRVQAARLAKLDEGVAMGNALAVTISKALFWPAVLGVDMSDVEEIEARALQDRNRRLQEIADAKGCPSPPRQTASSR